VQSVVWRYNEFGDKLRDIENPNSLFLQTTDCTEGGSLTREHCTTKKIKKLKNKKKQRRKKLSTAIEWDYGILPSSSIKGLPTDKNV
jgi:hypothetical protein